MKKYLFGSLAIALAVAFSAFTVKPTSTDYVFRFTGPAPTEANIEQVTDAAVDYFTYWELVEAETCPDGQQKACRIEVDEKYIKEISSVVRLLAQDITLESKEDFPMTAVIGTSGSNYRVNPSIESADIDVVNSTN
jgi:hypothetical protein